MILLGVKTRIVGIMFSVMLFIFIVVIISSIVRNLHIDCGCFYMSDGNGESSYQTVFLDVFLLLLSFQTILSRSKKWKLLN